MVGPDYQRPQVKLQAQWLEATSRNVATQPAVQCAWWHQFNDPALDELVCRAYRQNLTLRVAALRILEARAQLAIARGLQWPQMQELFASVYGTQISGNAPNAAGLDGSFINYQAGFDATWELDLWGRFRRNVQAAQEQLGASVAEYDAALVSLVAEVARTYTVIRTNEVLIALALQNIRVQEDGLRMAQSRFRNGATTELDVTQARTQLESTRTTVPQLQLRLRQAENALCILLGEPPGSVVLPAAVAIPVTPAEAAVGLPADLLRRRPDVRAAELSAAAQAARVGVAQAELYPAFSLFGEIGLQTSSDGGVRSGNADLGNLFGANSVFYTFGPRVRWPILNYGQLTNAVRVQDARLQQLLTVYQNTVLSAAAEAEDAMTGFLRSQEAAGFAQQAVEAAARSLELANAQYREGAVDFQRVLDSQRALLREQNSLAESQASIATYWIALYKALGGGWELRQAQPLLPQDIQCQMRQRTNWGHLLPAEPLTSPASPCQPAAGTAEQGFQKPPSTSGGGAAGAK
jgi:NodT family efflux transporter outer membrane factor (OMF) lipoprotein